MLELTDSEKLAIAQAFMNSIGKLVETKNPCNLRGRVDEQMKEMYRENPIAGRSYDVKVLGRKVGTYSLTVSKPKPKKVEKTLEVTDKNALFEWAVAEGFVDIDMAAVTEHFKKCGEIPDGCEPLEVVTPEIVGGEITKTTLKIDPEEVARALGTQLEPMAYLLLEGGFDD
jgi:hypothetical protein